MTVYYWDRLSPNVPRDSDTIYVQEIEEQKAFRTNRPNELTYPWGFRWRWCKSPLWHIGETKCVFCGLDLTEKFK